MTTTTSGPQKVYLAADGFGEDLKNTLRDYLKTKSNFEVHDLNTDTYFDSAAKVAEQVSASANNSMGILVCGTGMGVAIMANKFQNVRAAVVEHVTAARYARAVNDANILCLGQLMTSSENAIKIGEAFFEQQFNVHPKMECGQLAPWWNDGVETFLSTSKEGIARVEAQANSKKNEQASS